MSDGVSAAALAHTIAAPHLARCQLVAPTFKWITPGAQFDLNRRPAQATRPPEAIDQEATIARRKPLRLIAVNYDCRRPLATLMSITELDTASANDRRRMSLQRFMQDVIELSSRQIANGSSSCRIRAVQNVEYIAAVKG